MQILMQKIVPVFFVVMILLSLIDQNVPANAYSLQADVVTAAAAKQYIGYCDIVFFREKILAVGTDGRIDQIVESGEIIPVGHSHKNLLCAFANDEIFIAAGKHGTILYSTDAKSFNPAESATEKTIYSITGRNGIIIAAAENATLLFSTDGKIWKEFQIQAKGNILSLSSNRSFFIGITDAGEIIKSIDGFEWEIQDYNKEYAGFNPKSYFKKIYAASNTIIIIGEHDDGSPSILFSALGNVWSERIPFYYDDEGGIRYLTEIPNSVIYDPVRNQFVLACNNGVLFTLPTCSRCNEYFQICEQDLYATLFVDDCLYIAGKDFSKFIQK